MAGDRDTNPVIPDSHEAALIQFLKANLTMLPMPEDVGLPPVPSGMGETGVYVTVIEVSANDLYSLTGPSNYSDSIMQVNCFSQDREAAHRMRARVKDLVLNHSGAVGSLNIDGSEHILDTALYDSEREVHQSIVRIHMAWTS